VKQVGESRTLSKREPLASMLAPNLTVVTMRLFRYILFTIFLFVNLKIGFATGQDGEYIIFKGDTLEMLSEPLESYLKLNEPRENYSHYLKYGCSTGLYRGYVGVWEIKNDKLYLKNVFICGESSKPIKNLLFQDKKGDVLADWFTGELYLQKGKLIKYYHSGYERYYETEIVIKIEKGVVAEIKEYKNGVRPSDSNFPLNFESIESEVYKQIDWESLPRLSKKLRVYISFRITETGKLEFVKGDDKIDKVYVNQLEKIINSFQKVQIFYSRGIPLVDEWSVPFTFSRRNYRTHAR